MVLFSVGIVYLLMLVFMFVIFKFTLDPEFLKYLDSKYSIMISLTTIVLTLFTFMISQSQGEINYIKYNSFMKRHFDHMKMVEHLSMTDFIEKGSYGSDGNLVYLKFDVQTYIDLFDEELQLLELYDVTDFTGAGAESYTNYLKLIKTSRRNLDYCIKNEAMIENEKGYLFNPKKKAMAKQYQQNAIKNSKKLDESYKMTERYFKFYTYCYPTAGEWEQ